MFACCGTRPRNRFDSESITRIYTCSSDIERQSRWQHSAHSASFRRSNRLWVWKLRQNNRSTIRRSTSRQPKRSHIAIISHKIRRYTRLYVKSVTRQKWCILSGTHEIIWMTILPGANPPICQEEGSSPGKWYTVCFGFDREAGGWIKAVWTFGCWEWTWVHFCRWELLFTCLNVYTHFAQYFVSIRESCGSWIIDPENSVYDKLALNQGWGTMIRPATAFRFKDRIFGSGESLGSLFAVLGKWKDGMSVSVCSLYCLFGSSTDTSHCIGQLFTFHLSWSNQQTMVEPSSSMVKMLFLPIMTNRLELTQIPMSRLILHYKQL